MVERIPGNARMSSAVIHNGTVYLKGSTARNDADDIAAQTRDVLAQIDELLAQAGSSKEKVLAVSIWLADIKDFDAMNAVYDAWVVKGSEPVRACVEASLAKPSLRVEIQATASL